MIVGFEVDGIEYRGAHVYVRRLFDVLEAPHPDSWVDAVTWPDPSASYCLDCTPHYPASACDLHKQVPPDPWGTP